MVEGGIEMEVTRFRVCLNCSHFWHHHLRGYLSSPCTVSECDCQEYEEEDG